LANSLKTKIIAQAKLKDDKIDSNVLVDLLRADLVYESFVPDKEYRELRQLVRTRLDLVTERTVLKNKVHALRRIFRLLDTPCVTPCDLFFFLLLQKLILLLGLQKGS
jgi:transposase